MGAVHQPPDSNRRWTKVGGNVSAGEPRVRILRISSPLLFAPLQEFAEQGLTICPGQRPSGLLLSEEGLVVTNVFLRGRGRAANPFEHLLREAVARPTPSSSTWASSS